MKTTTEKIASVKKALSIEDVTKLSKLIRIEINEEEKKSLHQDLLRILDFVSAMETVDVTGWEPLFSPLDGDLTKRAHTPMVSDEVRAGLPKDVIAHNAPEFKFDHFVVPKVIEGGGS